MAEQIATKRYAKGFVNTADGEIYYYQDVEAVKNDHVFLSIRQLVAYYLVEEWTYKEGGFKADDIVRCQGRLFRALKDNTSCPYMSVDDGNGNIVVDENWNILTVDRVDEENWAHVLGGAPEKNLVQQIDIILSENSALKERITSVETENASLATRITAAETENATLRDRIAAVETENTSLSARITAAETENATLRDRIANIETFLSSKVFMTQE